MGGGGLSSWNSAGKRRPGQDPGQSMNCIGCFWGLGGGGEGERWSTGQVALLIDECTVDTSPYNTRSDSRQSDGTTVAAVTAAAKVSRPVWKRDQPYMPLTPINETETPDGSSLPPNPSLLPSR